MCLSMIRATLLLTVLSALTSAATAAMPCDENGLCKYGGVCGEDGMCACAFDCANELWGKELYCGSELGRIKFYRNLCQLRSHACELQRDVPIVQLEHKREYKLKCRIASSSSSSSSSLAVAALRPQARLCPEAIDFMGRCSARASLVLNLNSGICIEDAQTGEKFCKCPANREGKSCENRVHRTRAMPDMTGPAISRVSNGDESHRRIRKLNTEIAVLSTFVGVLFACFVAVACKYRNATRKQTAAAVAELSEKTKLYSTAMKAAASGATAAVVPCRKTLVEMCPARSSSNGDDHLRNHQDTLNKVDVKDNQQLVNPAFLI